MKRMEGDYQKETDLYTALDKGLMIWRTAVLFPMMIQEDASR